MDEGVGQKQIEYVFSRAQKTLDDYEHLLKKYLPPRDPSWGITCLLEWANADLDFVARNGRDVTWMRDRLYFLASLT